jgi:hypothetical protein
MTGAYREGRQGWEEGDEDEDDVSDDDDQGADVDSWGPGRRLPQRLRVMKPGIEAMYGTGDSTASRCVAYCMEQVSFCSRQQALHCSWTQHPSQHQSHLHAFAT